MNPNDYWKALRKSWIVILVLVLVGGAVGVAYASHLPDAYKSKSTLFVAGSGNTSANDLAQGTTFTQSIVASYADLATTASVLNPVIAQLNLNTTPVKLARQIDAQNPLNTVIINITVTDGSAQRSADIANAVSSSLRSVATDLAPRSTSGRSPVAISIVAPAQTPANPSGPNRHLIEITAAAIGLVVGILYAIARLLLDTRLRSASDVESISSVPVIGSVRRGAVRAVALRDAADGAQAEDYRRIAASLRFAGHGRPLKSVTITSATRGTGGGEVALDLALALAERSQRVLVIDADLRNPSLPFLAGLEGGAGLTDVLDESFRLSDVTRAFTGLVDVLGAGSAQSNPHFALGSASMATVVDEAVSAYDFVIVHAAPVLDYADALTISHLTEGTLVTARSGSTNRRQLVTGLESLDGAKVAVLGIVLTHAQLGRATTSTAAAVTAGAASTAATTAEQGATPDDAAPATDEKTPFPRKTARGGKSASASASESDDAPADATR